MNEIERRQTVVSEAMTWLRTPWHHEACVKGSGVDCANFLIGVYANCGLIEAFTPEHYTQDWMMHRNEQRFLNYLLQFADPIDGPPLPADIVMFHIGRCISHGGIVLDWPQIIHAYLQERAVVLTGVIGSPLESRLAGFYRLKEWK